VGVAAGIGELSQFLKSKRDAVIEEEVCCTQNGVWNVSAWREISGHLIHTLPQLDPTANVHTRGKSHPTNGHTEDFWLLHKKERRDYTHAQVVVGDLNGKSCACTDSRGQAT
jgi:hypothetical protein